MEKKKLCHENSGSKGIAEVQHKDKTQQRKPMTTVFKCKCLQVPKLLNNKNDCLWSISSNNEVFKHRPRQSLYGNIERDSKSWDNSQVSLIKKAKSHDTPVVINIPSTRSWFLNIIPHLREPKLLEKQLVPGRQQVYDKQVYDKFEMHIYHITSI